MIATFLDLYKSSSGNLISAIRETIKLIDTDGELAIVDMQITNIIQNSDPTQTRLLYDRKSELQSRKEHSVVLVNEAIKHSILDWIKMLEYAFKNPSLVQ